MAEPFHPDLLRDAAARLPGIDPGAIDAVVERGIQFAQRLSRPVPEDAYPLLAVSLRAGIDDLVLATQVIEEVSRPELPPVLVTMVTTAVLSRPELSDPVAAARTVLNRAASRRFPEDGPGPGPLLWQIAEYRAALDELTGSEPDLERYLRDLTASPGTMQAFAEFLGGAELFVQLTRTELDVPELDEVVCDGTSPDSETITSWLLAELYAGTSSSQRRVVTEWLTGLRSPTSQDDLAFLVDRIRRVERRLACCPSPAPRLDLPELERVRPVVSAAVRNGLSFPPLWTDRSAAINLAASKLRLETNTATWPISMLVASVVVRSLHQDVHQAADPDRPLDCACGADLHSLRTPRRPDEVCPHRPWPEPGRVEDLTTLARTARVGDENLAQLHLKRYQGLWREWIGDARDRMD
ncbi:hypothetical protein ABZ345_08440 [Lentzea sp. NPDC005914]|uniref:hypothetical protein n=1 Tax=Lentzea sp. NPDC005914 TaxID=3154572 RepID=UPI0033D5D443